MFTLSVFVSDAWKWFGFEWTLPRSSEIDRVHQNKHGIFDVSGFNQVMYHLIRILFDQIINGIGSQVSTTGFEVKVLRAGEVIRGRELHVRFANIESLVYKQPIIHCKDIVALGPVIPGLLGNWRAR